MAFTLFINRKKNRIYSVRIINTLKFEVGADCMQAKLVCTLHLTPSCDLSGTVLFNMFYNGLSI